MIKYQLSGYLDPSGNIQINTFFPMQISTKTPCEIPDIQVNGTIDTNNNTSPNPTLVLTSSSSLYTIRPGDLLLSSAGTPLKDANGDQIVIISGSDTNYILSGNPTNSSNNSNPIGYIIRSQ